MGDGQRKGVFGLPDGCHEELAKNAGGNGFDNGLDDQLKSAFDGLEARIAKAGGAGDLSSPHKQPVEDFPGHYADG